jgi:hypothetical protein
MLCSFTERDKIDHGNLLIFNSVDNTRHLRVSWPFGIIDYQTVHHYGPTNLAKNVPSQKEALILAKRLLPKLDISISDLEKEDGRIEPRLTCYDLGKTYFLDHTTITNIEFRAVRFRRSVDGLPFMGAGGGGDGQIEFGENGKLSRLLITWRNIKRYKTYPTASSKTIIKWIREGKAVQGPVSMNIGSIDWQNVKSLTITKAWPSYYGGDRITPSDWLMPYLALWTTVDTGHGNIDLEIDCPIIDESKL